MKKAFLLKAKQPRYWYLAPLIPSNASFQLPSSQMDSPARDLTKSTPVQSNPIPSKRLSLWRYVFINLPHIHKNFVSIYPYCAHVQYLRQRPYLTTAQLAPAAAR